MDISIRNAVYEDFAAVLDLVKQIQEMHANARPDIYKHTDTPIEITAFKEMLKSEDHLIFVAENAHTGKICAYAILRIVSIFNSPILQERKMLFMNEIAVDKAVRRQGIGKRLFQYIIDIGKELKADSIDLSVANFNIEATTFYTQLGMNIRSTRMEYIVRDDEK
ncbi:GNAT family N-acetyltransferase [Paenibacillus sediminis]|uniref:Ribosomal protein S18 acetylase RimI-like enzyme n=1 Tax=Paenibacillus sediminis TaxID=664909 RepID=A0ABS4H1Y8_9BACL|nr:GNAT family N-acetyltransferase [Paenibacillus sediminis]MBP1936544.1 ribosomal protein S18 acetylase RimI-like enzyme [Paenibacillus sediminis]